MGSHRSNVDHGAATSLLLDLRRESVASEIDALDVDGHDLVKLSLGNIIRALPDISPISTTKRTSANLIRISRSSVVH